MLQLGVLMLMLVPVSRLLLIQSACTAPNCLPLPLPLLPTLPSSLLSSPLSSLSPCACTDLSRSPVFSTVGILQQRFFFQSVKRAPLCCCSASSSTVFLSAQVRCFPHHMRRASWLFLSRQYNS
ncbi:unnamed protein product [Pleuronectes platessa]|uniref:Secreted protein n=1 Tax=Pleuronectes platessa TaxID=8262 RepID=A0A9N7YZZ0_PLEPL|nr:unnamed protein product [Pleuronectes platessa]